MTKIYLSNKELYKEIIISKALGNLTPAAQKMLIILSNNVIKKIYYSDPDDRYDCLQEGLYQLFKNWHLFDEGKTTNAFAYLTEVFKRGIAASYNKLYQKRGDEYMGKLTVSMASFYDDGGDMNI